MNDATEIHRLKNRITYLESLLTAYNIPFDAPDLLIPQNVIAPFSVTITPAHARFFYSLFHGRSDVYAKRAVMKNGKAGYFPVCGNLWKYGVCPKVDRQKIKCASCPNRNWSPLNQRVLMAHLTGEKPDSSDVIGIYPPAPRGRRMWMLCAKFAARMLCLALWNARVPATAPISGCFLMHRFLRS